MRRGTGVPSLALVYFLLAGLTILAGCGSKTCPIGENSGKSSTDYREQEEARGVYKIRIENDHSYGSADYEKFDLYMPTELNKKQRFPGVVIIHGGGWVGGDKARERQQNIGKTMAGNGYVCISINYMLAEEGKLSWPKNLHNCKQAVQFLRKNAELYHVDAEHIGVIGGSAGGHLSAMVGLVGPQAGLEPPGPYKGVCSRVQAVVALYGVHNLTAFTKTDNIEKLLGASKDEAPNLWALASPVNHIDCNDPPFFIIHGTADALVPCRQSIELHEKLRENGPESQLLIIDGAPHSFDLQPEQKDLRPLVLGFFDKHLKGK